MLDSPLRPRSVFAPYPVIPDTVEVDVFRVTTLEIRQLHENRQTIQLIIWTRFHTDNRFLQAPYKPIEL